MLRVSGCAQVVVRKKGDVEGVGSKVSHLHLWTLSVRISPESPGLVGVHDVT